MPPTVHVAGAALVKVNAGYGFENLGYTSNGADIRFEGYFQNVPGDENGGDDGPAIEVIYLGETAKVRTELTKWDVAVADRVAARVAGAVAGVPAAPGTLMFANSKTMRVCIASANNPMNFPRCICREPVEINKGTKYSRLIFEFEAYKNSAGVLYDSVTI